MATIGEIVVPGQLLGGSKDFIPGAGTHMHDGKLYASILGRLRSTAAPRPAGPQKRLTKITQATPSGPLTLSVSRAEAVGPAEQAEILPEVGSVVLCRVMRISPRQAHVAILVVGSTVLEGEWQGLIRVADVRATEKDRVKIYDSFRPGDIVRAVVISLGDQSNYYLSTAKNEFGVIMAVSEAGNAMYPLSWKEYKDPESGLAELRKVAKPF